MYVILAAKLALYEALKARFAGSGVQVSYAEPADARSRSVWFTDTVEPEIEPVALAAGRRKPSNISAELTIRAWATVPGDPVRAETAAYELRADIERAVLDDFHPHRVSGLMDARPVRVAVTNGEGGNGSTAVADVTLALRARIHT
ncbi:hypothetical protein [Amycolatopsis sp. WAC 01376]|uniref:hypothetical protein n=1 Tax=Amycolatopsis sp. WAC 01376 TaxID=2203195 RepID=UPI000F7B29B7|nr:hypothetical protein [Amycolatopsis sp. WAC 01376]